jgi:hypothetical protein
MAPILFAVVASAASAEHLPCSPAGLPTRRTVRACGWGLEPWAVFPEGTAHLEYVDNWTGLDKSVMDAVARIVGFNYTIQSYRFPEANNNDSWTDIAVAAARECDVLLGDWFHTTQRLQLGLLFTEHVGTDNTVIIASRNRHSIAKSVDEVRTWRSNPTSAMAALAFR